MCVICDHCSSPVLDGEGQITYEDVVCPDCLRKAGRFQEIWEMVHGGDTNAEVRDDLPGGH